jgi:hypothetical protein
MRPWKGSDGLFQSFLIGPRGLSPKRISTKQIGFEKHLHAVELLDQPDFIENTLSRIESHFAAARLKAIKEGIPSLNKNERESFAFFIALLSNRRPEKLKAAATKAADGLKEDLGDERFNANPSKAERATKNIGKYIAVWASMEFAKEICPDLMRLEWRIFDFSSITLKLVLADRPVRAWGEDGKIARLTLPLGPDHLFVAGRFPAHEEITFREEARELLAVDIIGQQFRQAANFVVAPTRDPYFNLAKIYMTEPNKKPPKGTL